MLGAPHHAGSPAPRGHTRHRPDRGGGEPSPPALERALTSWLVGAPGTVDDGEDARATGFADHLAEALSLDLPPRVVTPADTTLAAARRPDRTLLELGRANLLLRLRAAELDVVHLGPARRGVVALVGDSPYVASFALFLPAAIERWLPGADLSGGVLFAVPHRHALLLAPSPGAVETREGLDLLPTYAAQMYADGEGALTPHVYHWAEGRVRCVTTELGDGTLGVLPTARLDALLGTDRRAG
ncbi:hypothetical protein H9L10_07940 [Phycicoccus endophyticus]|uniref:Uncharacterized protein n=1 Tax=Phycicoccus endophyticus TaxID=1690220 RepID=A0A7G9QY66_9MICO|nr:hypothetical protein [Phycicoccus endophyticus]NHI19177.1 hypothetical protein [Phycicoccus endophyticus]QNN48291.1 hypothetical protein H9L10_07940 [Phycicoccus endophyticus]GGL40765.1 hypothetical protein GCM10012283_24120 [Phycicoccus endophyticus]